MTDLLIQNGTVITMESGCNVLSGGAVAVRDGRIAAVGKPADLNGFHGSAAQMALTPQADAARGVRIPLAGYLRNRIPVVLGTGGIGHDLFAVMRAFVLSARLDVESTGIVGPADALRMASRDGARALGLLGSVGSIEIGKKADLICVVLDPARFPLWETGNVEEVVAEACGPGDVTDVIVDGEVLMEG